MATGAVTRNANGIANRAVGKSTGDGTALSVTLGFKPMVVELINLTDTTTFTKTEDMPANTTLKAVAAGTMTTDTTSAITLVEKGFIVSAAANAAAKSLVWFVS